MPELPEVETTRVGIQPYVCDKKIISVKTRVKKLRWPIPAKLNQRLRHQTICSITRRGKYLLLHTHHGSVIIHLGMSGSLRIVSHTAAVEKHDHVDFNFDEHILRLRDPRKFGAVLWAGKNPLDHPLLSSLGPEPLSAAFNADYLYQASRQRRVAIKEFIMNSKIVVGVGNIYASEALFTSKIHPLRAAGKISHPRCQKLVAAIRQVLKQAIRQGGTSLRDFTNEKGKPGYFKQKLNVYGRGHLPCRRCGRPLSTIKCGQRTTTYCKQCQR